MVYMSTDDMQGSALLKSRVSIRKPALQEKLSTGSRGYNCPDDILKELTEFELSSTASHPESSSSDPESEGVDSVESQLHDDKKGQQQQQQQQQQQPKKRHSITFGGAWRLLADKVIHLKNQKQAYDEFMAMNRKQRTTTVFAHVVDELLESTGQDLKGECGVCRNNVVDRR